MTFESDMNAYLLPDDVVDCDNPAIIAQAGAITRGVAGDDISRAKALFEWVRDLIPHTRDCGREVVTCTAGEVLAERTGICYAKAHLLAALLRASGIPAGFCYQVYLEEEHSTKSKMALHGLNGVYLASIGRWIRVDSRGNTNGIDAQFEIDHERLAFSEMDFLDDVVYARPLPAVVRALRSAPSRTALWPHLPSPDDVARSSRIQSFLQD